MFSEQLRKARLNAGYTQKQLGEAIGKHKIYICQLEKNYCLPTEQDLQKICKILHTTPTKLGFLQVITPKTRVITQKKTQPRIEVYRLTVPLDRTEFSKLTKSNLKKCGYNNLREFMAMAYMQLENQLQEIENKEELWQKTK